MSNNDRKTLVILTTLFKLVDFYYKENDREKLLHRIQLVIAEYKIGMRKSEQKWVVYQINKFGILIEGLEIEFHNELIFALIFSISEHFRMLLKNQRRVVVWGSLENFISKKIHNSENSYIHFDNSEKIKELLLNDLIY